MNISQNTTFEFLYQKKATLPTEQKGEFHIYYSYLNLRARMTEGDKNGI